LKISETTKSSQSRFSPFLIILYGVSMAVFAYFLISGIGFYFSPYTGRPHLDGYRLLRPAGLIGHGLGMVGSAMMIIMLLYSLRKRLKMMQSWGSLSLWLNIHIYFGIVGPLLVILHTSFKVQGLVAISFWSMIAVALSGVLGRYLYLQIPRNKDGGELSLKEIDELRKQNAQQLLIRYGLSEKQIQYLEIEANVSGQRNRGFLTQILISLKDDLWGAHKMKKYLAKTLIDSKLSSAEKRELWRSIRSQSKLERRVLFLTQMQRIFNYWHVIHKPFAIIMYLVMVIHIGVAVWLGYKWIF
jgi:hypothetical protein